MGMIPIKTVFEIHMSADGKNICDKCVHKAVCRRVKELFAPCVKCNHFMEVVRCKDCKRYDFGVCLKIYSDGAVSQYAWQARNEDDYCSYGERKDNEI